MTRVVVAGGVTVGVGVRDEAFSRVVATMGAARSAGVAVAVDAAGAAAIAVTGGDGLTMLSVAVLVGGESSKPLAQPASVSRRTDAKRTRNTGIWNMYTPNAKDVKTIIAWEAGGCPKCVADLPQGGFGCLLYVKNSANELQK